MNSRLGLVAMVALLVATAGCIGAVDRSEFDDEVRARGGGVAASWIIESLDAIAVELGAPGWPDVEVIALSIDTDSRSVTTTARRGDDRALVDTVGVNQGRVTAVTPTQDADRLPLDDIAVRLGDLPIDDIEALADEALASFGQDGGYITDITVARGPSGPTITMALSSPRRTDSITFDASGSRIGGEP